MRGRPWDVLARIQPLVWFAMRSVVAVTPGARPRGYRRNTHEGAKTQERTKQVLYAHGVLHGVHDSIFMPRKTQVGPFGPAGFAERSRFAKSCLVERDLHAICPHAPSCCLMLRRCAAQQYDSLMERLMALLEGERDEVVLYATVACELHHSFDAFHWTGFYRVTSPGMLTVGRTKEGTVVFDPV